MAKYLVSDNATTTIATGISSGAVSVTVSAGTGALFPQPNTSTGTKFFGTFVSATNPNIKEVVTCTARTTDTMTIAPTTRSWSAGDTFALLDPAELFEQLVQFDDLQAQLGNYALDTGSANAYSVALSPALSGHVDGMPIRWRSAHANTGASTFNDGVAIAPLVLPGGGALTSGIIAANTVYTAIWNAQQGYYQLEGVTVATFGQLGGQIANPQVPQSAVLQFLSAILANAALTGTPTAPTPGQGTFNAQVATTAFVQTAAAAAASAAANPGSVLALPGFQALLSGLIIQFGSIPLGIVPSGGVSTGTGNFAMRFPNRVLVVTDSAVDLNGGNGSVVYNRIGLSTTQISYGAHGVIQGYNGNITIEYIAIGF